MGRNEVSSVDRRKQNKTVVGATQLQDTNASSEIMARGSLAIGKNDRKANEKFDTSSASKRNHDDEDKIVLSLNHQQAISLTKRKR